MAAPDQTKLRKRLENLLKAPDNQACADCRKRGPRWASANLGIFICIECSGIHRNLGVHISFVRSVNLDSWTTKQVEFMEEWGNGRANAYYEANLPNHVIRPKEGDPVRLVERFIRDKYEHKRYMGAVPPPNDQASGEPAREPERRRSTAAAAAHPRPAAHTPAPAPASAPAPAPRPAEPSLLDFMSDTPVPVPAQPVSATPQAPSQHGGFDAFGSNDGFGAFAGAAQQPAPQQAASQTFGGFDAFTSTPAPAQPAQKADLLDVFGSSAPAAAAAAPVNAQGFGGAGFAQAQSPKPMTSADDILSLYSAGRGMGGGMPTSMGHPGHAGHPQAMGHPGMLQHGHPGMLQHGHPGHPGHPGHGQMPPHAPQAHLQVPHYGNNMLNAYAHPPQAPANPFMGAPTPMGMHQGGAPINPFGQPSMGHPGMGHPGMGHPGMGHPGMGHPGMGHPGMGHPGMGHPSIGHHPGMGQPPQPAPQPANPFPNAFGAWPQQR